MSITIPLAEIAWKTLPRVVAYMSKQYFIEVKLAAGDNPCISVIHDTARIRFKLLLQTHGSPKRARKKVKFPRVKSLGLITKKAVSPISLGEIEGLELILCTSEMPASTDIELFVDFDVRVDEKNLL